MKKTNQSKKGAGKSDFWLFLFVLLITFAATAGGSFFYFKERFIFDSDFITTIEERQDRAGKAGLKKDPRRLYKADMEEGDMQDGVVLRKDTLLVVAEDVIRTYVKEYKVRLLDLYLDKEGVMYVDFGGEINKNIQGDILEELHFVAGLYKSVQATVPGFTSLKILIESNEAESIGGHIDISRPIGAEIAKSI